MKKPISKIISSVFWVFMGAVLIVCFQNCGSGGFESALETSTNRASSNETESTDEPSAPPPNTPPTTFPDPDTEKAYKWVSVGVGRGGTLLTSLDGFKTTLFKEQKLIPGQSYTDPSITAQCRYGAFAPYAPDHDPHMYRGVTFGNNRFVATGGCCHAIARVSTDGGRTWRAEVSIDKATVTYGNCPWAGDVAFAKGVFASLGGGVSMWSADGETWNRIVWKNGVRPNEAFRKVAATETAFMALGGDTTGVAISNDGINWEMDSTHLPTGQLSAGLGVFLTSNRSMTTQLLIYNPQTKTWQQGMNFSEAISNIYFDKKSSSFYLKAGSETFISKTALSWQKIPFANTNISGIHDGTFYSISGSWGVGASARSASSTNGVTWNANLNLTPFNPLSDTITEWVEWK